uniref:Vesicle associated membrane protein 5 n=1 Tax=Salvator merianae TaxID=96440 RepID=A0A8D0DS38_SALMN
NADKLQRCQKEAEEVTEIMLENYNKVLERDGKLSNLDTRAAQLRDKSSAFHKTARTVAWKTRWENQKCKIIIAGCVVTGLLIVILAVVLYFTLGG